jgi:hypothetical protein
MLATAGNWRKFESFAWFDKPENANDWAIVYTHNRDSDSVTRANAIEIEKALAEFTESGDAVAERHSHFLCGWVDGFALRGPAIAAYNEILSRLENYGVLCDETLSQVESEDEAERWENWARKEFETELEKRAAQELPHATLEEINAATLAELFRVACGKSNTYWNHDISGAGIDVKRVANAVDVAALDYVERGIVVYRDGVELVRGSIAGCVYQCDCLTYEREFQAVISAILEGDAPFMDGITYKLEG